MTRLENYLDDGADFQARATLMYLQGNGNIEDSWNSEFNSYDAVILVARWENCREQGYVVSLRNKKNEQLNIAFFQHRNSDEICAVMWEQLGLNTLTIDNAQFGDVYKDKYDVSHTVKYGEAFEMSEWIFEQLIEHWGKED